MVDRIEELTHTYYLSLAGTVSFKKNFHRTSSTFPYYEIIQFLIQWEFAHQIMDGDVQTFLQSLEESLRAKRRKGCARGLEQ